MTKARPDFLRGRRGTQVLIGLAIVILVVACIGPWLTPFDPYHADPVHALLSPNSRHWLGTDEQGRDVLSRLLAGARPTVFSAILVVAIACLIALVLAAVASVGGRWVDELILRSCDVALAMPGLVLALGIAMVLGPSTKSAIIALVVAMTPGLVRLIRTEARRAMTQPYVHAAALMGASRTRIAVRHVLPNSIDALVTQVSFDVGGAILGLGGLSFIGVGAQPPSAEWGATVAAEKGYVVTAWWTAFVPGAAITVCVVVFSLLGDAIKQIRDDTAAGR